MAKRRKPPWQVTGRPFRQQKLLMSFPHHTPEEEAARVLARHPELDCLTVLGFERAIVPGGAAWEAARLAYGDYLQEHGAAWRANEIESGAQEEEARQ